MVTIKIIRDKNRNRNSAVNISPENNIYKNKLSDYYSEISVYILPYLKDRPLSLQLKPYIALRKQVHAKNKDEQPPSFVRIYTPKIFTRLKNKTNDLNYLLCNNKQTLNYALGLGCVDFFPWNSRISNIDIPDYIVMNIDSQNSSFKLIAQTALTLKDILDSLKIKCYPKTSGNNGLHIYIPVQRNYTFSECNIFAGFLAQVLNKRLPDITTLEKSEEKRSAKVFIDSIQNKKGKSLVSPYSVRPFFGFPVSAPVEWNEVTENLNPLDYNINTIPGRLKEKGDPFRGLLEKHNNFNIELIIQKISQGKLL